MPDGPSHAQRVRRANWVGLRTLRQRPTVVGETEAGDPIFEARSVRLILRPDASHFNRLVQCSRCGTDVAGSAVHTSDDLDRSPSPVICQACVKTSQMTGSWRPEARRAAPPVVEEEAEAEEEPAEPLAAADAEPVQEAVGAVSRADVMAVITRLTEAATTSTVEAAVAAALEQARAELGAAVEGVAARMDTMQAEVRQGLQGLNAALEAQRADVAAVSDTVTSSRAEIERMLRSGLDGARQDLDGRLEALAAALAAGERRLEALDERTQQALREVTGRLEEATWWRASAERSGATLLQGLDAQLRAAEDRLAERAVADRVDMLIAPERQGSAHS